MARNEAWLALTAEDALEPDLPICDPHHHLWEGRDDYIEPRYLLDDILVDLRAGHNIVSTVFVECGAMYRQDGPEELRCVGETEFVNGIAAMSASGGYGACRIAAGIVGYVPLLMGDAASARALDAQIAAGNGRFRGIRVSGAWHASPDLVRHRTNPPPNIYAEPGFLAGFAHLAPRGLTFEGWCYHTQIPHLTALARAFPDTTIILDHFGGPLGVGPYAGRGDEVFAEWRSAIGDLAACPNVVAKLGGLVMSINGFGFERNPRPPTSEELMQATRRYYEHTIELFGVERCMFESNFPVDKGSCSYTVLWNSFKRLTAGYSPSERASLFHDTAARVYRL
ncbi:amidohydrolase family protein [Allostella humosa]|uniref:amidohydrolase family protein n=1 Tax=Stella humosa TaxID=94 RepID=UPI000F4B8C49|nr:amidohydrolase family protein [Stella humosa]